MAKYRQKPVVFEAEQFDPSSPWPKDVYTPEGGDGTPYINTRKGPFRIDPGDYIVTGAKGDKYPCSPGIFEATYERVESVSTAVSEES